MAFLFGGARPTQENTLKSNVREIQRHTRELERDLNKSLLHEKELLKDIKVYAMKHDISTAKVKAKELIRARVHRKRIHNTQQILSSLSQELTIMSSSCKNQDILAKTTKILQGLNSKSDLKSTYQMLSEFERQSSLVSEKQEILSENLDGMLETDDEMASTDDALSAVFQEIGLDLTNQFCLMESRERVHEASIEERLKKLVPPA